MFRGSFEHTVDEKGRVAIPVRYRDVLQSLNDERIVVTNFFVGQARCLDIYPHGEWVKLEEKIGAKPQFDKVMVWFQQYYFAPSQECTLDKQGRILLPPNLRTYAGLDKDALFVPVFNKFRLWNKDVWQQVHGDAERGLMENPDLLAALGI